jgi:hypothetical protein
MALTGYGVRIKDGADGDEHTEERRFPKRLDSLHGPKLEIGGSIFARPAMRVMFELFDGNLVLFLLQILVTQSLVTQGCDGGVRHRSYLKASGQGRR